MQIIENQIIIKKVTELHNFFSFQNMFGVQCKKKYKCVCVHIYTMKLYKNVCNSVTA